MLSNIIKVFTNLVESNQPESLQRAASMVDFESVAEEFLNGTNTDMELLSNIINVLKFVEEETTMDSVISDETYDKLVEIYQTNTGDSIVGTKLNISSGRPTKKHLYPELVGTLGKVHFLRDTDIPEKDSRHSLESWINKVVKSTNDALSTLRVFTMYKYDGLSIVLECVNDMVVSAVTRRDTDDNIGLDVSHIFRNKMVRLMFSDIPNCLTNIPKIGEGIHYGIKIECMMTQTDFEIFREKFPDTLKHRRSAVSKIVNTLEESYDPDWFNYLTTPALQISSDKELDLLPDEEFNWLYIGKMNDRHVYINRASHNMYDMVVTDINRFLFDQEVVFENMQAAAQDDGTPIDGAVITVTNLDIIEHMGRSNSINKFQIAYKFPAGIKKTKLIDVEFPVGPVAGTVTPLAIVEPVVINGCTITNVGLSNYGKLERLNLRKGDEVIVKYDIIPKMYKDDTCKSSKGDAIIGPLKCPVCKMPLAIKDGVARCANYECESKIAGRIYNYIEKLGIMGIGMSRIVDLVNCDVLQTIPDLYRIQDYENNIIHMSGYGKKTYDNMLKAINSRRVLYPHELIGSIGIPDIGRRVMKKICSNIPLNEVLSDNPDVIDKMLKIKGVGDKTVIKLCDGIERNRSMIEQLMKYIELKPYEEDTSKSHVVLFTKVRDVDFSKFLEEKCGCEIAGSLTKAVDILIAGGESSKTKTARERGIKILTLDEAKSMFNYNK